MMLWSYSLPLMVTAAGRQLVTDNPVAFSRVKLIMPRIVADVGHCHALYRYGAVLFRL